MHPQLEVIAREYGEAEARLQRLAAAVPRREWLRRPDPDRWSIAECVAHLNLTARAYLPLLRDAVEEARRLVVRPPRRYRRDAVGWLLWRTAGPPVRRRVRTTAPFVPGALASEAGLLETFAADQRAQLALLREGDGLPLDRVRIRSPFDARFRYNAYACFSMLPRHQHRHLWQAEQVLEQLRGRG